MAAANTKSTKVTFEKFERVPAGDDSEATIFCGEERVGWLRREPVNVGGEFWPEYVVGAYTAEIWGEDGEPDQTKTFTVARRRVAGSFGRACKQEGFTTARQALTAARNWVREQFAA